MGILGKIEDFFMNRKEEAQKRQKIDTKRRKNIGLVDHKCVNCGHHKAWKKDEVVKCTKCSFRERV